MVPYSFENIGEFPFNGNKNMSAKFFQLFDVISVHSLYFHVLIRLVKRQNLSWCLIAFS